jgi:hypothetical protein
MGKIDRSRDYGRVYGSTVGIKYVQDGKSYNGRGIELDSEGNIADPNDLLPDVSPEEPAPPINNRDPQFQRDWRADRDPPADYIGLGVVKNEPQKADVVQGSKCDECEFVAKTDFGLRAHKRYKHSK